MATLRRLFLLSILFSMLFVPFASPTPVLFEFSGRVRVGDLNATAPTVLNLSTGVWPVELSVGNVTLIFNLSVGDVPLVVRVDEPLLDGALSGFSTATVFLDGRKVPTPESEKSPCMSAPNWTSGEGETSMMGPSKPVPMETVLFASCRVRDYLLLPSGLPVAVEYAGVKKYCLFKISADGGGWSSYGGCSRRPVENAVVPVQVRILSKPANATVYVNDFHLFGEWFTPMRLYLPFTPELSSYSISLGANGYPFVSGVVVSEKNLTVFADLSALSRVVSVHPEKGTLKVSTRPSNASLAIFAGNRKVFSGRSPLRLALPAGTYTVSASLPGYGGIVKNVTVPVNGSVSLNLTLSPLPAELNVTTVPLGAEVRVGNRTCTSPCSLNLTPGVYNVSASLRGYLPNSTLVLLSPGDLRNISLQLVRRPILRILTSPGGATVTVGEKRCLTPCNISLIPGNYSVTVEKEGYEKVFLMVSLHVGDVTMVNVSLRERLPLTSSSETASHETTGTVPRSVGGDWEPVLAVLALLIVAALFIKIRRGG
ncbi:PEGA domain-containing protein [Thermococcus aciditolerans]|uniref:PEGA domain-containing protein n=1 Tax=Thermococcus aciditolerans TaxID=2598455 RepID=A0A5C0SM56_9EURY|nr:PEGA domain-containing protein [Thermococcus aciditolerans]QEK15082.1 PEGA domain-containing protein [Thermococcus aciditolerans]